MKTSYIIFLNKFPSTVVNEPLAKHTTFRIGGPADLFLVATDSKILINSVLLAKKLKIKYKVLGIGSNVLVSDSGFRGLIIKNKTNNLIIKGSKIKVDSGVLLSVLVKNALENNLDLSFLAGIPSTVGGAIFGNAGLPDKAIGNVVKSVNILNTVGERVVLKGPQLKFDYRKSNLQKNCLIISAELLPEKLDKEIILEKLKNLDQKRTAKNLPGFGAGSIFKNTSLTRIGNEETRKEFTELFGKVVPAGYLLETAEVKKIKTKNAFIWDKHANIIINNGKTSASEVNELIEKCRKLVYNKYKVQLELEIQLVGF